MALRRQFTQPTPTGYPLAAHCTPFSLPSNGVLRIASNSAITLTSNALFTPQCTGSSSLSDPPGPLDPSSFADLRDAFYASTLPQTFAISAATTLSYMLVIMLLITPRTFYIGGVGGGGAFLGRRGLSSSGSVIGVGGRPWLQKVAAFTVAISLTMATAETFETAELQYEIGYQDAAALRQTVEQNLEIRIVRTISDMFLWLAQVQTLIRLFPRHKEKVIIKWTGFALIFLDTLFSILNQVITSGKARARDLDEAIAALDYLFALALSILYAGWVIYYSVCKRKYAFYHPSMVNICLVALLSLVAVFIPVTFFVLDITNPRLAYWGDYVRWVGAAAASVVVWEWVERIEALEREAREDGVLGREIFDEDEMLEVTLAEHTSWQAIGRRDSRGSGGPTAGQATRTTGRSPWGGATRAFRIGRKKRSPSVANHKPENESVSEKATAFALSQKPLIPPPSRRALPTLTPPFPSRPLLIASPVSRADSMSAASTDYTVHYHPVHEPLSPTPETIYRRGSTVGMGSVSATQQRDTALVSPREDSDTVAPTPSDSSGQDQPPPANILSPRALESGPSVRTLHSPLSAATQASPTPSTNTTPIKSWNLRSKLSSFASSQHSKIRGRPHGLDIEAQLPITVIPAQPRGEALSPTDLESLDGVNLTPGITKFASIDDRDRYNAKGKAADRSPPGALFVRSMEALHSETDMPLGRHSP
ncbi:MAG: pH-response regulator protein palH/rim21 [Trizodia sp. TS-e1964]|nr:MAG: pH-response regulator protein palH/rim21 [Trizodia sp. TS-e1964]